MPWRRACSARPSDPARSPRSSRGTGTGSSPSAYSRSAIQASSDPQRQRGLPAEARVCNTRSIASSAPPTIARSPSMPSEAKSAATSSTRRRASSGRRRACAPRRPARARAQRRKERRRGVAARQIARAVRKRLGRPHAQRRLRGDGRSAAAVGRRARAGLEPDTRRRRSSGSPRAPRPVHRTGGSRLPGSSRPAPIASSKATAIVADPAGRAILCTSSDAIFVL